MYPFAHGADPPMRLWKHSPWPVILRFASRSVCPNCHLFLAPAVLSQSETNHTKRNYMCKYVLICMWTFSVTIQAKVAWYNSITYPLVGLSTFCSSGQLCVHQMGLYGQTSPFELCLLHSAAFPTTLPHLWNVYRAGKIISCNQKAKCRYLAINWPESRRYEAVRLNPLSQPDSPTMLHFVPVP